MFSKWTLFVMIIIVLFSGLDSRRRNRRRNRVSSQSSPRDTLDPTLAKRQRMIDMRESLADSLSTNKVRVFVLDNGSPQLVKGRAAIRRMSARHEEMTAAQVMRLINLLERRIRDIDKALRSENRQSTNLQTVTQSIGRSRISARTDLSDTNHVSGILDNDVARRLLVNGRLRSPARSSGRMAVPSTFRSETVDRGRLSVPLTRNSQNAQRTTGSTRQSSSRRTISARFSPSFEERLRHSPISSRLTGGRASVNLRHTSPRVRSGGDIRSSRDRAFHSKSNTASRAGSTDAIQTVSSTDGRHGSLLTDTDLKNRAPNTPFRDFLTAGGPSKPEQSEPSVSETKPTKEPGVVRPDTTTSTRKAEVGGSILNDKKILVTNKTTKLQKEANKPKLHPTKVSPQDTSVAVKPLSTAKSKLPVTPPKTTSQTLQKSTNSAHVQDIQSNSENKSMLIAKESKVTPSERLVQVIPQEEPPVPEVQSSPTRQIVQQEEPKNPSTPEQEPPTEALPLSPAEPKANLTSKEVKSSPSSAPETKTITKNTAKKQEIPGQAKNTQETSSSIKPKTSSNADKILSNNAVSSTQQALAEKQASAQIPSPTNSALVSTTDKSGHALNKDKAPHTSSPKDTATLQEELQKMIEKHKEQEAARTGSTKSHEDQMKAIKKLLSEIAGSPGNELVTQTIQTTTQTPLQQIIEFLQAQKTTTTPPIKVPQPTSQSAMLKDIITLMKANEALTNNPTQAASVNQLPYNPQVSLNAFPMMHQHTVIDPMEQQRMAMMSQMGNPMAGMFGGMMGYMNPEMMQEMMFGDTTDAPDPVKGPEEKKGEEQEEIIKRAQTTTTPATTTVTMAQPLRHRTQPELQPSYHNTLRDPNIQTYRPIRHPETKSSWQEMDVGHLNTRRRFPHSDLGSLSLVKHRQEPLQPSLLDSQIREQHRHKENFLETQETSSNSKSGFAPTVDPNMLLKIKASIERALEAAGIAKDVEIVLTDNNENKQESSTPTGNQILDRVKASIEKALQSAGISKNVKLVLKSKESKNMPVVTKAPVITTKAVLRPTDSSWITHERNPMTDMQTKPTTKTVKEALHGGMSFLSYSERPAKIPADSPKHVFVQHNVRQRNRTPHPLDSLMIGHITTASPNHKTSHSKDLPHNVELLGGFSTDINQNEQGNRLTRDMAKNNKDQITPTIVEDGSAVLANNVPLSETDNAINRANEAETIPMKSDGFDSKQPMINNRIIHRISSHNRNPSKDQMQTSNSAKEYPELQHQSKKADIFNKIAQVLGASKHKGLIDSLSKLLQGKQNERTIQGPASTGTRMTTSENSQVQHRNNKDISQHASPPSLLLSQAPNKVHQMHNHIISAPLEPVKSNDKVFENINVLPNNRHESRTFSNMAKSTSDITLNSNRISTINVLHPQSEDTKSQAKKTLQISPTNNVPDHPTVPSNGPRMINTASANAFSGANLFRRQTQGNSARMNINADQQRMIQSVDVIYQQKDTATQKKTQASQRKGRFHTA